MQLADPLYYLNNFQTMIATLCSRDGDLLAADERGFIEKFAALPTAARALLVRMVMRKGELVRESRRAYPEITALTAATAAAIAPLVAAGWVDAQPRLSIDELFRLLPKAELVTQLGLPRQIALGRKAAMLDTLRDAFPDPRRFDQWCGTLDDRVYRLTVDGLCERLRLLFFGNFRQTLREFVLADLGVFKFEKISHAPASRPFCTRAQVDAFFGLHRCREMLRSGTDPGEVEHALPPPIVDCEWLQERREKLRFQIGLAHERAGSIEAALRMYRDCSRAEAWPRAGRLQRVLDGIPRKRPARDAVNVPEFRLSLDKPTSGTRVESSVRVHLEATSEEATCVYHVENALINSLFGLLCWRAVFAQVQGAFFHAFHHGPADLSSAGFHKRRAGMFAECLAQLHCGAYKQTIRRHFIEKSGISSPFVAWGLLDETLLELALRCFPAGHLRAWFDWILRDVIVNRTGFPDLVQFWPASARYRLIEIKGPGDRLQDNQRRCLAHCVSNQMPVSVCRVSYSDRVLADAAQLA